MPENLPAVTSPTWVDVPYVTTTDRVLGGLNGPSNASAKALHERTEFLKQEIDNFSGSGDADLLRSDLSSTAINKGANLVGYLPSGTGASTALSVEDKLKGSVSVADFMTPADLISIANGTQSAGVALAFKNAIAHINTVGGTLYIPPGHYKIPYLDSAVLSNWYEITKSGVTLHAAPGSVVLENFLIYIHGIAGSLQLVGATGFSEGDTTVNTATAHGLVKDDYIQVFTGLNAYTSDSGDWQLGSTNPTYNTGIDCIHSEIHKVASVTDAFQVKLVDSIWYANYKNNTVGQSFPIAGITGARVRKLTPVQDINIEGITFKNINNSSFREVFIRYAVNVNFNHCQFLSDGLAGSHVKTTDTSQLGFFNCKSYRSPVGASGSSWNSFVIGGGSQDIIFSSCVFKGEQQTIDISPNLFETEIGYSTDVIAEYATAQFIIVTNCIFNDCSDGVTTHPATYNFSVTNNLFEGCSTGIRVRSKNNTISANTINAYATGISLSAFYENTLITSNNITQRVADIPRFYTGIIVAPLSSEILNTNALKNVVILSNIIKVTQVNPVNSGISFLHLNEEDIHASFTLFTDNVKTALSDYIIQDNIFENCSIKIGKWINGVNIIRNTFGGGSDQSAYIISYEHSARHTINLNTFTDNVVDSISVDSATVPTFGYTTLHRIGYQYGKLNTPTLIGTTNCSYVLQAGFGVALTDNTTLVNGGTVKSTRTSGGSTLYIDATPIDNISDSFVKVFTNNTSSGDKYFEVTGNVVSENSYPLTTATYTSGIATRVWSGGFTQTAFTITSDDREKTYLTINDAELLVAQELKGKLKKFKFNSAISSKGADKARIHFGVSAQEVKSVFEKHGLNAFDYALLCHDSWDASVDEEGTVVSEAGDRYGIRYEELLMFILTNSLN